MSDAFENMDAVENEYDDEERPPEESSNRMFWILGGIIGLVMVLSLICIAVVVITRIMPQRSGRDATATAISASNAAVQMALTETVAAYTAAAPKPTATLPPRKPTDTPTPSPTPLVKDISSPTPEGASLTETAKSLLETAMAITQPAMSTAITTPTSTLPQGGFADEVGLPGLFGLAGLLIVVIFLARKLRTTST
jgi:hypothetical protein